jgi:hypothetical protein
LTSEHGHLDENAASRTLPPPAIWDQGKIHVPGGSNFVTGRAREAPATRPDARRTETYWAGGQVRSRLALSTSVFSIARWVQRWL